MNLHIFVLFMRFQQLFYFEYFPPRFFLPCHKLNVNLARRGNVCRAARFK